MKLQTIYLDADVIDLSYTFWGVETISINNQKVSSKWSIFGTIHEFEYGNNRFYLKTGFGIFGIAIDLNKNSLPVIQSNREGGILIIIAFVLVFMEILYKIFNSFTH